MSELDLANKIRQFLRNETYLKWDDLDKNFEPFGIDEFAKEVQEPLLKMLCEHVGHEPVSDQCGKPEHDFCHWCNKLMPGAAH